MDGRDDSQDPARRDLRGIHRALWVIAGVALVGVLTLARPVLLPLLFALVISMALHPVVRRLARAGLPPPVGAALLVLLITGGGVLAVDAASGPVRTWAAKVPDIVQRVRTDIGRVQRMVTQPGVRHLPLKQVPVREVDKPKIEVQQVVSFAGGMARPVRTALVSIGITLALVYFMLATGGPAVRTANALLPSRAQRTNARRLGRAIQQALVRYLGAVTLINLGLGAAVAALLGVMGLPGALFFGAMVTVLNYVPFVGATLSVVVLALASFTVFGITPQAFVAPLGLFVLHLLESQFVTPFVVGRTLTLNPLFVMISIFVFGIWWGIGGAFLAVPLLVAAKVSCDAVPRLRGWGQILGRRRSFTGGIDWLEDKRKARAGRARAAAVRPTG